MRIAVAAAEVAPYAKVGGLADVAGSLPQALAALGHEVTVYLPFHRSIDAERHGIPTDGALRSIPYGRTHVRVRYPEVSRDGVRTVFVRNDQRIGRERVYGYADDAKRYALFARAVMEDLAASTTGGSGAARGDAAAPAVLHAHDWHTALLVPMIQGPYRRKLGATATAFTIHNLAYQGRTSAELLPFVGLRGGRTAVERRGELNPMARAIATADAVTTVSERYAREILTREFGEGLQSLLARRRRALHGIVNGIDTRSFDPATDRHIAARYSASDIRGKRECKAALQKELHLAVDPAAPLFGVIGRLVEQKGVDILTPAAPALLAAGAQIAVLGTGDPTYEARWRDLATAHAGGLALVLGFEATLAQRIYAGADLLLMPSRFEPCGLGQLISLRYGTVPVVRAVGGLADTVHDLDADPERGNGFSFREYTAEALADAARRAMAAFRRGGRTWAALRERGMREDHSWTASARRYVEVYGGITARGQRPSPRARSASPSPLQ